MSRFIDWNDPKNKCCRTCKYVIYVGRSSRMCKLAGIPYTANKWQMVVNCKDWEISTDNIKKEFR